MATTTYGYKPPRFGLPAGAPNTRGIVNPQTTLASALAGYNPLRPGASSGYGGYAPTPSAPQVQATPQSAAPTPGPKVTNAVAAQQAQQPITPGVYDLNTDPILQQIQALAGMNDQQAQAEALKERQQLLLGYGDQNLANAVLGANDPTGQAAAQNPTSVLAQLLQQRDVNSRNLTEGLNANNLLYSGYRVLQEQQAAQDYQNALAQAAQNAQGGLDTIAGNLAGALQQNANQRAQAAQDAYNRQLQLALQAGYGPAVPDTGAAAAPSNAGVIDQYNTVSSGLPVGTPVVDPGFYTYTPAPAPTQDQTTRKLMALALLAGGGGGGQNARLV